MSVLVSHCGLFWALGFQYQILEGNLVSWGKCCYALKQVTIYSCGSVAFRRSQLSESHPVLKHLLSDCMWMHRSTHGFQEKKQTSRIFQILSVGRLFEVLDSNFLGIGEDLEKDTPPKFNIPSWKHIPF